MSFEAWITLAVIGTAVVLFATELLATDLVALLAMAALILTGVLTLEEGVDGFSNPATLTVAFMFVLSESLIKSGAVQKMGFHLSGLFRRNFRNGFILMILMIAFVSAFINNTPIVAVFIPIALQIAHSAGISETKLLIPVSYAALFGGVCTLIGTSTNIVVSGIAESSGLYGISMFSQSGMGMILLLAGTFYLVVFGVKLLPEKRADVTLREKFNSQNYLTEFSLLEGEQSVGHPIMKSALIRELGLDIIEVRRAGQNIYQPGGDFILQANDLLKVRCDGSKILALKTRKFILANQSDSSDRNEVPEERSSTLIEMIITSESEMEGKTLRELDFRRRFRAIPLAIRQRDEILNEHLYEVKLKSGDVILAEAKSHFVNELRKQEALQKAPFILLSQDPIVHFDLKKFRIALLILLSIVLLAATDVLDILAASICGVLLLVIFKIMNMKELYDAIQWKVVFMLAGALSLGAAMRKTGLDAAIAESLVHSLQAYGPHVLLAGFYLVTNILTAIMSNNASAALLAPIAISLADQINVSPYPFLMAVIFAASADFSTPVGYQTNTMVYSAGQYKFTDFLRVGTGLNLIFWILCSLLIPLFFPF